MKWHSLPGPASFIAHVMQQLRDGSNVVVAASLLAPSDLEDALYEQLAHERLFVQRAKIDAKKDPLQWLTEELYLEPDQWVGWNVERLFNNLPAGIVLIEGVVEDYWDAWKAFLRDFEAASRQRPSDDRPVLLVVVRGVPRKRLHTAEAALATLIWNGVFSELDTLTYVDQCLRSKRTPPRHHKLIVRQIAALALWDLELADYLAEQPERNVFNMSEILKTAAEAFDGIRPEIGHGWERGGTEYVDGGELLHPFILINQGDPSGELQRRVWSAQAAELLPLIEVRRRELVTRFERSVTFPVSIEGKGKITSLEELEIGSLVHLTRIVGIRGEFRERAELLSRCRNTLAHLRMLIGDEALDARIYG